ncbi:Putative cell wall-binding domain-like protein [Methanococcus aeolicus Nankai-3]|uniref:Cell wall-binding domain-like protein n=1 Tax=Methanococcus aeolicus (strain ATCC BAA-1280 / DSM 17508 / OCM 812 / Nankai-3) TaxID=419665 RepID=A6UV82_META3|nr:cell wall-binding repeat-containing protein [Methanococcus aeolicus]ABR56404.1 Putative cell wall-binding domain-like protein [Methanococcus aeolicus Nankai-3]
MKKIKYIILSFLIILINGTNAITIGEEKPSLVDVVVITNDNWVDCLSAINYAYENDGVILQTNGDKLNPEVEQIISAINPKKIVIVGGNKAISYDIEKDLEKYGTVVRIWGMDRVETNEKVIKQLNTNKTMVLVNAHNFSNVVKVSNQYIPVYVGVMVFNPNEVVRYYNKDTVHIYKNNRLIGTYSRNNVVEVPKKIIVIKKPNIDNITNCYGNDIEKFGYIPVNIKNSHYGVIVDKNNPSALLLSKYLGAPAIMGNDKKYIIEYNNDSVNNSIIVSTNIIVLKKAKELYLTNNDVEQSLNEAKTQLWSKKIPVDKYDIPHRFLRAYVEK